MAEEVRPELDDSGPWWASPGVSASTPLVVAASVFVEHLGRTGASANTVAAFAADLRLFCRATGCDVPVGDLTRARVEGFYDGLLHGSDSRCCSRSLRRRATALQALFRYLADERAVDVTLAEPVSRPPEQSKAAPPLSEEEVPRLLEASRELAVEGDPRALFLALLVLTTGLSKSECLALRADDFDLVADTVTLHRAVRASDEAPSAVESSVGASWPASPGEGEVAPTASLRSADRQRVLPLSSDTKQAFLSFREKCSGDGRLFSCTGRNLEYVLNRAGTRAGLGRNPSFRLLRATSVALMVARGSEGEEVVATLGISPATWPAVRRRLRTSAAAAAP